MARIVSRAMIFAADGCLDGDFELLHGDHFDEFFADRASFAFGFGAVDEAGEGIDGLFIDADFELDDIADLVFFKFVIERAIAAGDRFEFVIEIGDDLVEREAVGEEEAFGIHRLGFVQLAALFHAKAHDGAEIFGRGHDVAS